MYSIDKRAARRFLLLKQGLLGEEKFIGKAGALAYVRQCGCIQFDPVDACGRNAELTLQSRVKGFSKQMLADLLYRDRALFDYPDKELAILPVEDWPYFERYRALSRETAKQFPALPPLEETALAHIAVHGPADAASLPIQGKIRWHSAIHWSGNWHGESMAARSVLEQMYADGRLVIHHKDGARKSYDLASRCLPPSLLAAPDPLPDDFDHLCFRVLRRIGAVGLLWDRRSDAYLGIDGLDTDKRHAVFDALECRGKIQRAQVAGVAAPLFFQSPDAPLMDLARSDRPLAPRCAFLAPLDPMLWDRKLIRALFDFQYSWEIYTPADRRKFGYYTLPILYGESFVGRVEPVARYQAGVLEIKRIWYEEGVRPTKKLDGAIQRAVRRFARFNQCGEIRFPQGDQRLFLK